MAEQRAVAAGAPLQSVGECRSAGHSHDAAGTTASVALRNTSVRFLQEQGRIALSELHKYETARDAAKAEVDNAAKQLAAEHDEVDRMEQRLAALQEEARHSRAVLSQKDGNVQVVTEQNRKLVDVLESREKARKAREEETKALRREHMRLSMVAEAFRAVKDRGDEELAEFNDVHERLRAALDATADERKQLQRASGEFTNQAATDSRDLERQLAQAKGQAVRLASQLQLQEAGEHSLHEETRQLRAECDELQVSRNVIKVQQGTDRTVRTDWVRSEVQVQARISELEKTGHDLEAAVGQVDADNETMCKTAADVTHKMRAMSLKVADLMEVLQRAQSEAQEADADARERDKRIDTLSKHKAVLESRERAEMDAKLEADREARQAVQIQALLQKKAKKIEDALNIASGRREDSEREVQEIVSALQAASSSKAYLEARADGMLDDRMALGHQVGDLHKKIGDQAAVQQGLEDQDEELGAEAIKIETRVASLNAELDYIKREDLLDESGRAKPILIEAYESSLVEKLQVNEFLFEAQRTRNPVPMLVDKIANILELLHSCQAQADRFVQDLRNSNKLLRATRSKNAHLFRRAQQADTWKMRALTKLVSNSMQRRERVPGQAAAGTAARGTNVPLYLDGLHYGARELVELQRLVVAHSREDDVDLLRLQDNQLGAEHVPLLQELLLLMPYLRVLDLRRNCLSEEAQGELIRFVSKMHGVTSIQESPAEIIARSGPQARLRLLLSENSAGGVRGREFQPGSPVDPAVDRMLEGAADRYLVGSPIPAQPARSPGAGPCPGSRPGGETVGQYEATCSAFPRFGSASENQTVGLPGIGSPTSTARPEESRTPPRGPVGQGGAGDVRLLREDSSKLPAIGGRR